MLCIVIALCTRKSIPRKGKLICRNFYRVQMKRTEHPALAFCEQFGLEREDGERERRGEWSIPRVFNDRPVMTPPAWVAAQVLPARVQCGKLVTPTPAFSPSLSRTPHRSLNIHRGQPLSDCTPTPLLHHHLVWSRVSGDQGLEFCSLEHILLFSLNILC